MRDLVYLLKLCTNLPLLLVYAGIVLEEEDQPEPTESGAFHLGMASHVATKRGREGGREGEKIERERATVFVHACTTLTLGPACGCVVSVNVQDTAGQEKYHALGPIYYRNSNGAVLVYDITDQDSFQKVCVCVCLKERGGRGKQDEKR